MRVSIFGHGRAPSKSKGKGKGSQSASGGRAPNTSNDYTESMGQSGEAPQERGEETPVRGRSRVRANAMSYHESTDGMKRKRFWMSGDGIGMSFCGLQMIATLILYFALHVSRSDGRI